MTIDFSLRRLWVLILIMAAGTCPKIRAQTLQYAPSPGVQHQYEFDIRLDLGTEKTRLFGVTTYDVATTEDDQVEFKFRGGLTEKRSSTTVRAFPPRPRMPSFGPRHFGLMNDRPTYRGLTTTTNTVALSKSGELLSLTGESQLPYLLGHLSLLPFEPLPDDSQAQWQVNGPIAVLSETSPNVWDPFGQSNDRDLRSAEMNTTYRLVRQDEKKVFIEKQSALVLKTPKEGAGLKMTGRGEWVYDKELHMPAALDFVYDLELEIGGVTLQAPLTLKYHRLTEAEIQHRQETTEKREAESKRLAQERLTQSKRPVSDSQRETWLENLKSVKQYERIKTLQELTHRDPDEKDSIIVEAIRQHLNDPNRAVSMMAKAALKQWDPAFQRQSEWESKYSSQMPLDDAGRGADPDTLLYPGQWVQVRQSNGWWKAAEIIEVLPSGRAEVQMRDHWKEHKVVSRNDIQLPPEEFKQPIGPPTGDPSSVAANVPKAEIASPDDPALASQNALTGLRTWKDTSGLFTIEASLLLIANDTLVLQRKDGRVITVPTAKMSQDDQAFVSDLTDADTKSKIENPFE